MEKAHVYWFFGLSGSGKSTMADALAVYLKVSGVPILRLDGDQLRTGLNKDLGFSSEDRLENVRRAAEIAKLSLAQGISVVASFITPEEIHRKKAREILGTKVHLIFVDASMETCRQRDVKGLYHQEGKGNIQQFTGVSAPFERPIDADMIISTEEKSVEECLDVLEQQFKLSKA